MALPHTSRSDQEIHPLLIEAARELIEPVRRAGDAAVKRLRRRLQSDPEMRDIPVEIITAAVLDLLTPTLREAVIKGLLEEAQNQFGRIYSRQIMGDLTGVRRQNVEHKFDLIQPYVRKKDDQKEVKKQVRNPVKKSAKRTPVPGPRTGAEPTGSIL